MANYKVNYYTRKSDGVKMIMVMTTYAGKVVRGVAKCNPIDEFDGVKGEALARARCDLAVAEKRFKNAAKKNNAAQEELWKASAYADKMNDYFSSAEKELAAANKNLKKLMKSFK